MVSSTTKSGIYASDFAESFEALLAKTGVSCYQIAQYSYLNESYLSRLRSGEKKNPSPETIMKIALALTYSSDNVNLYDVEQLFNSVGRSLHVEH
jgi:transcriptional regulator with XRE-family HTH domain